MKKKKENKNSKIEDSKLKILQPTLRQKKRYLLIKIIPKEKNRKYTYDEIYREINKKLLKYLGIIDFGKGGIWILKEKFNYEKQFIVIRASTKLKDKTVLAISLINKLNNEPVKLEILRISGTLKSLFKNKKN